MKALRALLAIAFLLAGLLLGARLAINTAVAGELPGASPPATTTGALFVRAGETLALQASRLANLSAGALSRLSTVGQLEPQAAENVPAAVGAAVRAMLMPEDEQVYLPLLRR